MTGLELIGTLVFRKLGLHEMKLGVNSMKSITWQEWN